MVSPYLLLILLTIIEVATWKANFFAIGIRKIIYLKFSKKIKRFTAIGLERKYSKYSFSLVIICLLLKLVFEINKFIQIFFYIKKIVAIRACRRNSYESALASVANTQMLFSVLQGQAWVFLQELPQSFVHLSLLVVPGVWHEFEFYLNSF